MERTTAKTRMLYGAQLEKKARRNLGEKSHTRREKTDPRRKASRNQIISARTSRFDIVGKRIQGGAAGGRDEDEICADLES